MLPFRVRHAAVLLLLALPGDADAQVRALFRAGVGLPMGDYAQTSEGWDLFARPGWTAGVELHVPLVEQMYLFASWDRMSNPVDEDELEAAAGVTEEISADPHVVDAFIAGLRVEGAPVPDSPVLLSAHAGMGLGQMDLGDYSIGDDVVRWEQASKMGFAVGFGLAVDRFELGLRFYPMGTFRSAGIFDEDKGPEIELGKASAPVRVTAFTLAIRLP